MALTEYSGYLNDAFWLQKITCHVMRFNRIENLMRLKRIKWRRDIFFTNLHQFFSYACDIIRSRSPYHSYFPLPQKRGGGNRNSILRQWNFYRQNRAVNRYQLRGNEIQSICFPWLCHLRKPPVTATRWGKWCMYLKICFLEMYSSIFRSSQGRKFVISSGDSVQRPWRGFNFYFAIKCSSRKTRRQVS